VAVYGSTKAALDGRSLNDLLIQCVDDKAFKQYVSKSVRTYTTSRGRLVINFALCYHRGFYAHFLFMLANSAPLQHVVNAFMVSPVTLLYTIPYNKKNFDKVRKLSMDYMAVWLDMLEEKDGVLMKDIYSKKRQAELLRYDMKTRMFCKKDPDTVRRMPIHGGR